MTCRHSIEHQKGAQYLHSTQYGFCSMTFPGNAFPRWVLKTLWDNWMECTHHGLRHVSLSVGSNEEPPAVNAKMEKKRETTTMSNIGTTLRIHSALPS